MEGTYQITPDMLGLTWRQILLSKTKELLLALLVAVLIARNTHGLGSVLGEVATFALISTFLMRPLASVRLRITDTTIEDLDGPIISKDSILSATERTEGCLGLEVLGQRSSPWLPKYRIFIPAALPEFQELKQVILGWQFTQQQH